MISDYIIFIIVDIQNIKVMSDQNQRLFESQIVSLLVIKNYYSNVACNQKQKDIIKYINEYVTSTTTSSHTLDQFAINDINNVLTRAYNKPVHERDEFIIHQVDETILRLLFYYRS